MLATLWRPETAIASLMSQERLISEIRYGPQDEMPLGGRYYQQAAVVGSIPSMAAISTL